MGIINLPLYQGSLCAFVRTHPTSTQLGEQNLRPTGVSEGGCVGGGRCGMLDEMPDDMTHTYTHRYTHRYTRTHTHIDGVRLNEHESIQIST